MKDVLLNIGSVVSRDIDGAAEQYLITGKRVINFKLMKAFDYYGVKYPEGSMIDKDGIDSNSIYFNHTDISETVTENTADTSEIYKGRKD